MVAPRIDSIHTVLSTNPALVEGLELGSLEPDVAESAFVVVSAGAFGGRWFERGDVLVCTEGARPGQAVVLVAHGRGRPRLGHQRGQGFTGDRGEPCSSDRWMAAGAVQCIWTRADGQRWLAEEKPALVEPGSDSAFLALLAPIPAAPRATWPGEGTRSREGQSGDAAPMHQLSLFGGGARPARAA